MKSLLEEEERRAAVLHPPTTSGPPPSSCFRAARLLLEILHLRENEATRYDGSRITMIKIENSITFYYKNQLSGGRNTISEKTNRTG